MLSPVGSHIKLRFPVAGTQAVSKSRILSLGTACPVQIAYNLWSVGVQSCKHDGGAIFGGAML